MSEIEGNQGNSVDEAGATSTGRFGRFVLVEDDRMLRDLLASSLQARFQPQSLAVFGRGREAVSHVRTDGADVLVCDLRLPDVDGREVIRTLKRDDGDLRVVVLTGQTDMNLPAELVALGVAGFVDKSAPLEHAVRAIERVLSGGMYFFAGVAPRSSGLVSQSTAPFTGQGSAVLTSRERDVVRLVATGLSSKETASELGLSVRTVENYRASAMRKVGVRDAVGLVRWCMEQGLA